MWIALGGERKGGIENDFEGFSLSRWYSEVSMAHSGRHEEWVQGGQVRVVVKDAESV